MYNCIGLGLEPKLTARRYAREYIGGNLKFREMEFGEIKRNTSNWSNFCMLLRRAGLTASAGLSCCYYHNNKGGSSVNLNESVWSANPKTPVWCKILWPILNVSWVIVICVWKFQHSRYHDNRGWSDTNFTYTVKSADPENPLLAYESWWYLIHKLSYSRFSDKIYQFFVTMATRVGLAKISMTPFDRPTPKPQFGAEFWDVS